jgi:hypothetical protein
MRRAGCLLLAAFVVAGCGGGGARLSKSEYEAKLRSTFAAAYAELGDATRVPGSVPRLKHIAASYSDVVSSLHGVHAPPGVQQLNDRLVATASAKAVSLNGLVSRLDGASAPERQRLLAEYDTSQADFDSAVSALEAKGYRFRPSAGT